jgi:predicted CopG family antitoxin
MLIVASKTVNLSVEAYQLAAAAKRPGESFSELLLRTFRPASLWDLAGLLTTDEADAFRQDMQGSRGRSRARSGRLDARLLP